MLDLLAVDVLGRGPIHAVLDRLRGLERGPGQEHLVAHQRGEGLLIEAHPNPAAARSDGAQALDGAALRALWAATGRVAPPPSQ